MAERKYTIILATLIGFCCGIGAGASDPSRLYRQSSDPAS